MRHFVHSYSGPLFNNSFCSSSTTFRTSVILLLGTLPHCTGQFQSTVSERIWGRVAVLPKHEKHTQKLSLVWNTKSKQKSPSKHTSCSSEKGDSGQEIKPCFTHDAGKTSNSLATWLTYRATPDHVRSSHPNNHLLYTASFKGSCLLHLWSDHWSGLQHSPVQTPWYIQMAVAGLSRTELVPHLVLYCGKQHYWLMSS